MGGSARAAVTEFRGLGAADNGLPFSHGLGTQQSKAKVPASSRPGGRPLPGLRTATSSWWPGTSSAPQATKPTALSSPAPFSITTEQCSLQIQSQWGPGPQHGNFGDITQSPAEAKVKRPKLSSFRNPSSTYKGRDAPSLPRCV